MSIDKVDVKLAIVQKLESGIKKPATLASDVVNYFGAVNISIEEVTAVIADMQQLNLIKPAGIGKSFLGLVEPVDAVRKAISDSVPNAVPVVHTVMPAPAPAPMVRQHTASPVPTMSIVDQAKAIVVNTLRERSVGQRTLVNKLVMQFGVNVCSPDDAEKIINELFRERVIENAGGDRRQFIRIAEQHVQQIMSGPLRKAHTTQPRKEPVARNPPKAVSTGRGRKPFTVDRAEIESFMTAALAERSVGRVTLINKVMTYFGAASLDVKRAEEVLDALLRKGVIEQAGGDQRSLLALRQSKHASPIAEAVQKFVMKKGSVSLNTVRNFVARQLNETDGRRIQGTVAGSLRQLDPDTRKPLFVNDGNIVRFDPNHNKYNNDHH